jgi:hypothetical protein
MRRFPAPWKIEPLDGGGFKVVDASKQAITAIPVRLCVLPSRSLARNLSECRIHGRAFVVAQAWSCPLWAEADM